MRKRSDNKKHSKSNDTFKPFSALKTLIENKSIKLAPSPAKKIQKTSSKNASGSRGSSKKTNASASLTVTESEHRLFMEAMADVTPLARDSCIEHSVNAHPTHENETDGETEILAELNHLIRHGKGFVVAHTPEYIEGTGHNIHPRFAKRLHRGDFSIQAHLDLHGLGVLEAKDAFDRFIKESIATGKRAVLIVHGRGLSSPQKPVLKTRIIEWLTIGPWRKWVIAYTSARSCDGGAGATYVLLRQRPVTKRLRKRKPGR